ncbi:MAG TPA: methionyl-tRNA formyltransferase [Patescibacteria group bacterium]
MQTNIVFFGSSAYVLPILEKLQKNFAISLVVTTEKNLTDAVPSYCQKNNIEYISTTSLKNAELQKKIQQSRAPIAVLADFGLLVPQSVLDIFPKGIINIHPSLLPKYRGSTPGVSAIANGDTTTGISIMLLDKELDHGPILAQEKAEILPSDTGKALYERLFAQSAELLLPTLIKYLDNKLTLKPQDESLATYTKPLTKESGFISLDSPPANLENIIRAYFPWPGAWTKMTLFGKEKIIKLLPENMLQVEGKKPMSKKDFLNGYPDAKEALQKLGL